MQVILVETLLQAVADSGPLLVDVCVCQHCGTPELTIVPESRGFEHTQCPECGDFALDQVEP